MKLYFIEAERTAMELPTADWFDVHTHKFCCPSLALVTLASLTPDNIEVKIIDEKVGRIDFNDLPNAVAISFKTMSSNRAYDVANKFRERNVKVILGGLHASLMPEEAKRYCDSVVIGEGEEVWPRIIEDLRYDKLQPFYRMPNLTDLSRLPGPRIELLKIDRYAFHAIQASRGCSLGCDFCPTREMFGGIFRTKPIKKVIEEIELAKSIEDKDIFFTDDIFCAGNEQFTLELLREIKKIKVEFFIISDFLVLNKKIVTALARSGCRYMCLNLPGTCSREEEKAIRMIQTLGIDVWGYFMFGFRFHEKDVFKKAEDFVHKTKMKHVSFTVMTPYPNTAAGKLLDEQNRILSKDWQLYDQMHVVFKPEKMRSEDLEEGFNLIKQKLGYLSQFDVRERRSKWKTFTGKCLAEISGMLPNRNRKN